MGKPVVEWLDSEAVASKEERLFPVIPDCEREHSAQMLNAVRAIFFVQVNYCFGVTVSRVAMPASLQILSQLQVVVNLAVEDDRERMIFVTDGLVAGREVDDAEAAHPQSDRAIQKKSVIVGASILDYPAHRTQNCQIC